MLYRIKYYLKNRLKPNKLIWLLIIFVLMFKTSRAQEFDSKLQIVFIYQATHYFQWPDDDKETFTIGVIGKSALSEELHKLAAVKKIKNKTIIIKQFDSASSITDCNILFIPYKESLKIDNIKKAINGKHTLLISEKPGMAEKGTCINFVSIDGMMKFELNQSSYKSSGLRASSKIEKISVVII